MFRWVIRTRMDSIWVNHRAEGMMNKQRIYWANIAILILLMVMLILWTIRDSGALR